MNDFPNEPPGYDRLRVAATRAIHAEIQALGLPLIRMRKLNGIYNALVMQIEDGGDHPEVNALLVAALRRAVLHQVDAPRAAALLGALDAFEQQEQERWEKVRLGLPLPRSPLDGLDDLTNEGTALLHHGQPEATFDRLQVAREYTGCFPDDPSDTLEWVYEEPEQRGADDAIPARVASIALPPAGSALSRGKKPGRNDPCWCGSGHKYKKCHLTADRG